MTGLTECGEGRGSNPTPARGRAPSPGRQAFAADCTDCRPACRSPLVVDGAVPAGSEGASCVVPLAARWFFFLSLSVKGGDQHRWSRGAPLNLVLYNV